MLRVMVPMIEESENWTLGKLFEDKAFNVKTQTFYRNKTSKDGAMWHGRVSDHPKDAIGGFEAFWNGIGVNHTANEKEYYDELDQCKLLKKISDKQEIWAANYALRPPASNRLFSTLITTHVETDPETGLRTGYVLSTPVNVSSDPEIAKEEYNATKGAFSAVERVKEMPDGSINWRMITTSTPGGYIPQFVVDRSLPAKIAEDVPAFLKWLSEHPSGISGNTST
ncbi:hypothetical protein M408DRAFT_148686 [Serendipita vermifera MAFF 305830]|uniref:DUF3074 domain-containing protein n=1 Tax=Serendipita vermifera MAFF 305830 TaxID=933852 RepID=A0A0C3ALJ4_SERVB|nr:hypothetical protein M408DRAFT_148686 [Serendipita vermifera MAFF 305830]